MAKLTGKIAVVTGGTGGLGQTVVQKLSDEGASVISVSSGRETISQDIPEAKIFFRKLDVTNSEEVSVFFNTIIAEFTTIDFLCNLVGGVLAKKPLEEVSAEEWSNVIQKNMGSVFYTAKNVLPIFKKNGFGRIVNIAAAAGINPEAYKAAYSVSKAGVIAMTKAVSEEVKILTADITVNAIAPSIILTEENKKWGTAADFSKWVSPAEIAEMICFLLDRTGRSINGQIIQMNGKV